MAGRLQNGTRALDQQIRGVRETETRSLTWREGNHYLCSVTYLSYNQCRNYMKCNNSRVTHLRTGEDGRGRSDMFEDLGERRRCGWQALNHREVQRAARLLSWRVCLCWHYDEGSWQGGLGSPAPFRSNAPLTLWNTEQRKTQQNLNKNSKISKMKNWKSHHHMIVNDTI